VEGLHRVALWWPDGDQEQEQFVADIARAADGILQWTPELHVAKMCKEDTQGSILSALHNWQPVQTGQRCGLDLSMWELRSPASLASVPPAVQYVW
jgi:hypothetical protein